LGWDLCVGLLYEHRFAVLIIKTEKVKYFGHAPEGGMEEICWFFFKCEAGSSSGHLLYHAKMIHLVDLLSIY